MQARSLEHRIKTDHGLPVGRSLVILSEAGRDCRAVVEIAANGAVDYVRKPHVDDGFAMWCRLRGDLSLRWGCVIIAPSLNADFMSQFEGEPVAVIPVTLEG